MNKTMKKEVKKYVENNIDLKIECLEEDLCVRGNVCASGDDEHDRECENQVIEQLERGNLWAWCMVKVSGICNGIYAENYLGGCSYEDQESFERDLYFDDMKDSVINQITLELLKNYQTVKYILNKEHRTVSEYLKDHSDEIKKALIPWFTCQKSLDHGIEVRLAVDTDPITHTVWTGSVDYDTYHSRYCASSEITNDTDSEDLVEDLIEQILDQVALNE